MHPLVEGDLPSALSALCARHGASGLRVEPELEPVAARLGVRAEPLPEGALLPRAVLAFAFLSSHRLFRKPSSVASLLEACAFFETSAPWTRLRSDDAFPILMTERWRCWNREFAVLGSGSGPRGLELHEKPGTIERLRDARLAGTGAPKVDSLLVAFETGPSWALEAVRAGYGLRELPTVIRMKPGSRRPPEPLELLQLAAALRSAALLGSEDSTSDHGAHVTLDADGYELTALARYPLRSPAATPASHPYSWTPRNALCPCGSGRKFKRCHLTPMEGASERA